MIDVLPTSHSAIFNTPPRKIPPSLFLGVLFAVAVHGLLAFYLITQGFHIVAVPEAPAEPKPFVVVTMDKPDLKPVEKPKPQPQVIRVHEPLTTIPVDIETAPTIPYKGPAPVTDNGPIVLPTEPVAPPAVGTGTETGPVFVEARWTRFPDAETLSEYYPQGAIDDDRTGTATVECTVLNAAGQVRCTSVSETPKGYGFGKATAAMISAVGRVDTSQGNVKPGSVLRKSVTWTLAD